MIRPITPSQVVELKQEAMPEEVIEAFNELIIKNWNGHVAKITKNAVINLIIEKLGKEDKYRTVISDKHYLDVEDIFEKAGWEVEFSIPSVDYCYDGWFRFSH